MLGRLARFCGLAGGLAVVMTLAASPHAQVVTTSSSSAGDVTTTVTNIPPAPVTPAFGTGAISGIVTDGRTGLPLEGVVVHLSGGGAAASAPRPGQLTDARGRFVFTHLPAFPDYVIAAARAGYMAGGYKRAPGILTATRIAIRDTEWLQTADVELWKPASISGTVRDEHGDPVVGIPVRALVSVQIAGRRQQAAGPATQTDDRGVYRLADLQPGDYVVHVPSVQITLPATAAPARPTPTGGRTGGPAGATASLPDVPAIVRADGNTGLMAGYYATPPPGSGAMAYAMAFHPAALSPAQATPVSVEYGDELENIDVQLSLVPTVSVSGQVTGPAGALDRLPVRLLPVGSESLALGAEAAFTQTDAQGVFTLLRVPSGEYTLIASRSVAEYSRSGPTTISTDIMPSAAIMITSMSAGQVSGANGVSYSSRSTVGAAVTGRMSLSVGNRDLAGLVVPLTTGVKVSGHFLWDGEQTPPDTLRLQPAVGLEPADGDLSLGVRNRMTIRQGTEALPSPLPFDVEGVLPGRYLFSHIETAGFVLEGIDWNGRNLLTTPLEVDGLKDVGGVIVSLTSKRISLSGSVRDDSGPATSGAVLTFPASPALWRNFGLSANLFKTSTIVSGGTYRVDRLVPGDYLMVAVPDEDRSKWVDPDFLTRIAGQATRVHVAPGATLVQDLRLVGGKR